MRIRNNIRTGVPTLLGISTIKAVGKNDSSPNGKRFVNKPRLSKDASKNIRAKFSVSYTHLTLPPTPYV